MSVLSGAVLTALCWLGGVAANVWTTDCRVLATQRLDPIVFPGHSPAGHVHTVAGGSRFNKESTYEDLQQSNCTRSGQ